MEHAVYFWSALIGCTLLVIQVILQIIGLGGDHEMDSTSPNADFDSGDVGNLDPAHGTQGNIFFGILSFKTLVAFAGIFGLTGLALERSTLGPINRIAFAALAGFVAMVVVAYMMRALYNLGSSGSVVIRNALGHQAEVYLRIPGKGEGHGKVTVEIQGRTFELPAVTDGEEIATGRVVKVVEIIGSETVKVVPA
ncbi:MAG: DUF1449 family protein [Planctomycetota bacterium]|nr:DUF1449 family protein [Planctomycetota bacterium]